MNSQNDNELNNHDNDNGKEHSNLFSGVFDKAKKVDYDDEKDIVPTIKNNNFDMNKRVTMSGVSVEQNSADTEDHNWRARFVMSEEDKKKRKIFSTGLSIFYVLCFSFIVIGIVYWWDTKETFYLSSTDISMITNDNYQIGLYGKTEEKKMNEYIYTSSNPDIVKVDENGIIHSVGEGEATITVKSKYSSKKNIMNINVEGDSIYSVELENENVTLNLEEKKIIKPIVNGNPDFKADFIWKSENSRVAYVSSSGEIRGVTPGTTYIIVKVRGTDVSARLKVNVTGQTTFTQTAKSNNNNLKNGTIVEISDEVNDSGYEEEINTYIGVVSVEAKTNKNNLTVGDTAKVTASISPDNATNREIIWNSSDESIATVDKNGNVKTLKSGTVDITVKTKDGNKTSFVTLNIKDKPSSSKITLNKKTVTIKVNESTTITASSTNNQKINWTSSDSKIATVDKNGKITGIAPGRVTITAATVDGKAKNSVTVTVEAKSEPKKQTTTTPSPIKIQSIVLNKSSVQITKGSKFSIKTSIKPVNATNKALQYISNNKSVATVNSNGEITAVGLGSTTIKVSSKDGSGKVASIKVVVVAPGSLINISNKKYSVYRKDIANYINVNFSKHMQNFAIQNIGTTNEIIYLSGTTTGCITAEKITASQKADLNRTFVIKIPINEINTTTKNRTIMWLKNSGHGQPFDIEKDGTMWINAISKEPTYRSGKWWGGHNGIMRIKFNKNVKDANFSPLTTLRLKDSSGTIYSEPDVSIDEDNDLIALRSSTKVFVYKLSEAKKGKLSLLYSFKISNTSTYRQGQDLYGGYFYMLNGIPGGKMSITAYNMLGEKQYTKSFYISNEETAKKLNEEPEGLKIYGGKIYIGHTHKYGDGYLFDIGVFK